MEKKVELFICENCELLLMKIDKKYVSYTSGEFCGTEYEDNDSFGDDSFDGYVCPSCSGIEQGLVPDESSFTTLKRISIPKDVAKKVKELWEKLFNTSECHYHGIPLNNPELKELLTEHLI